MFFLINNSLSKIISASAYLEIPYHKFWVSFFRIGDFCFATCTHICSGGSWATGTIFTPKAPATKPKSYKAEAFEVTFDYETYVNECVENVETIVVDANYKNDEDIF